MKRALLLSVFFLFLVANINAQVTWPTFSVTPPTSGCNGVWKINCGSTGGACGTTPYIYTFTPLGCATTSGLYFSLDTLSIPLCAVPCDLALDNASGQTCLAMTGGSAGINDPGSKDMNIYPSQLKQGEAINIDFFNTVEKLVQIFDETGRAVETISTSQSQLKINTGKWAKGMYYISITSARIGAKLSKVVIQ